jgi:hypothetical protein
MLDGFSPVPLAPNVALQARPIARARHERRLLGVACKRLLGQVSAGKTRKLGYFESASDFPSVLCGCKVLKKCV